MGRKDEVEALSSYAEEIEQRQRKRQGIELGEQDEPINRMGASDNTDRQEREEAGGEQNAEREQSMRRRHTD